MNKKKHLMKFKCNSCFKLKNYFLRHKVVFNLLELLRQRTSLVPEIICETKDNSCCQATVTDQHLGGLKPCGKKKSNLCKLRKLLLLWHSVLARVALSWRRSMSLFAQLIPRQIYYLHCTAVLWVSSPYQLEVVYFVYRYYVQFIQWI